MKFYVFIIAWAIVALTVGLGYFAPRGISPFGTIASTAFVISMIVIAVAGGVIHCIDEIEKLR